MYTIYLELERRLAGRINARSAGPLEINPIISFVSILVIEAERSMPEEHTTWWPSAFWVEKDTIARKIANLCVTSIAKMNSDFLFVFSRLMGISRNQKTKASCECECVAQHKKWRP
jgi:hypothetical protein